MRGRERKRGGRGRKRDGEGGEGRGKGVGREERREKVGWADLAGVNARGLNVQTITAPGWGQIKPVRDRE